MGGERVERRLAAILVADVAGYSRLMGVDEEGTLRRLNATRRDLIDPKISEHRGRLVKTTGDGFLVEFASAVDALRCATEMQSRLAERNLGIAADQRLEFRIGIHQGDILVEDGDIFGDGVNIAARLEALAPPGGICVSHRVQEDAAGKLDLAFRDLGDQQLHNIARQVRAYAVGGAPPVPRPASKRGGRKALIGGGMAAALAIGVAATWWGWPRGAPPPTAQASPAVPHPGLTEPRSAPRLSIVVLPFANLSGDPERQHIADGITEDLTTDLSRLPGMLVISRNSAFTYRDKHVDTRQIGRELGVRYVLEGSVQRLGDRLRLNAQLIDAETDTHLWADRFDRDMTDFLELQNDVTGRIAVTLNLELVSAESARPSANLDALDYILRARAVNYEGPPTGDRYMREIDLFEHALAADPTSFDARAWLANGLTSRILDGFAKTPVEDMQRAEELLAEALAATPRKPFLHFVKAQQLRAVAQGGWGAFKLDAEARSARFEAAIPEYEIALASNPNDAGILSHLGWCKFMIGVTDDAKTLLERSIRLSPRDPGLYLRYFRLGTVLLFQDRIDDAIDRLESAHRANPSFPPVPLLLTAGYGLNGDTNRATRALAEFNELGKRRGWPPATLAILRKESDWNTPRLHDAFERYFMTGMRKAGLKEE